MEDRIEILKVLVGSHAHGLATPESDRDYRGVFVTPTSELLKLGGNSKTTNWIEGEEDSTSYEIGHFLNLATKSNPSILEVFKAPLQPPDGVGKTENENGVVTYDSPDPRVLREFALGCGLRLLFPHVWSSIGVYNAFSGYSHNQRTKLFDEKAEFSRRRGKYAVAHIRVLLQGIELLKTGDFSVQIHHTYLDGGVHLHLPPMASDYLVEKGYAESWRDFLFTIKGLPPENFPTGLVVDVAQYLKGELKKAYEENPNKETNIDAVNDFLLEVRKEYW